MVLVAGKMYRPTDVTFDVVNNTVYVVEQFNHRISKWNYTPGSFTFTIDSTWGDKNPTDGTLGGPGPVISTTDSNFYRPTGIAFDFKHGLLLYVTDTFHHRVRVIDTSGTGSFTTSIGTGGSGDADFYRPAGIAIDSAEDVVVIADEFNHRAVRYIANGTTLITPTVLPDPSTGAGLSFVRPHGVVWDVTATEFNVTDSLRSVISRYSVGGVFQGQYGIPGSTPNDVNLFFPGSGEGLLVGTVGPATIFADTRNNALKTMDDEVIVVTTADGSTPNAGTPGTGDGQLYYPESVVATVDTANYVLAANTLNNRVEVYSSAVAVLTFQEKFGSP